jgi:alanyl-tRNA synthetase
MKSKDLREAFLNYFNENGHTIVKSAPLIPQNDPSLLFVNAGMVQFKDVFLGKEKRDYSRATSCQKCVRAGGKHNDLENVGYTARHHTFFEMLGNFSFGDYFKKEAIHFGWEFITKTLGLDKSKLWVTVFKEDDDAFEIWNKQEGVPSSRIIRMGAKDNFWSMGDTGPCGPCSEIHIDQGESVGCGRPECSIECECDRYLELWNLVFMQFDRDASGKMTPLPKPSIDTGLGLERVSAIMQGVQSNFDTDLFVPIINSVSDHFDIRYGSNEDSDVAVRVISDHLRATDFLISDGVFPDKEGRGYVLRRIMRRAMRFGKKLGTKEPFLHKLIDVVNEEMGEFYPEIIQNRDMVINIVKNEEEQFFETLEDGLKILNDVFKHSSNKTIKGEEAFKLYDTYGFPIDLTVDIAAENEFSVDLDGFNALLEKQREMSKANWKGSGSASIASIFGDVYKNVTKTEFVGYDEYETQAKLLSIVDENENVVEKAQKGIYYFIFDKTPFYAESGGQIADSGFIFNDISKAFVDDVQKYFDGNLYVHKVSVLEGEFSVSSEYTLRINVAKRKDTARHHTATHLLDSALMNVLGGHVRQAGSLVEDGRFRFDFTHFNKPSDEELDKIEFLVNSWIFENYPVTTEVMGMDEATKSGAVAIFEEKYSDVVRVVSVGSVSKELCGGTHVKSSGEIGVFKIVSEGSLSKGVRRIEAKVGMPAFEYIKHRDNILKDITQKLGVGVDEAQKKIEDLKSKKLKQQQSSIEFDKSKIKAINGVNFYIDKLAGIEMSQLRHISDSIKAKLGSGAVVMFNEKDGKINVIAMVTKDITNKIKAKDIVSKISKKLKGKGGGKDEFAQGGGKDVAGVSYIIEHLEEFI